MARWIRRRRDRRAARPAPSPELVRSVEILTRTHGLRAVTDALMTVVDKRKREVGR